MIALAGMLDRCRELEARAAALYRSFAVAARGEPASCALWTELARDEEQHVQALATARARLAADAVHPTEVEGWEETLAEVAARLDAAERLGTEAGTDARLAAALDLELSELERARHVLLQAAGFPLSGEQERHAERLAHVAAALTDDPHVRLRVALLRTRLRTERA